MCLFPGKNASAQRHTTRPWETATEAKSEQHLGVQPRLPRTPSEFGGGFELGQVPQGQHFPASTLGPSPHPCILRGILEKRGRGRAGATITDPPPRPVPNVHWPRPVARRGQPEARAETRRWPADGGGSAVAGPRWAADTVSATQERESQWRGAPLRPPHRLQTVTGARRGGA